MQARIDCRTTLFGATVSLCLVSAGGAFAQAGNTFEDLDKVRVCSDRTIEPQFDDFYASQWNCAQSEIDTMWEDFAFDASHWGGLGHEDPCNKAHPLGKTFNALQLLKLAPPGGATCSRDGGRNILEWGYCFANRAIEIDTMCRRGNASAETTRLFGDEVELLYGFFNNLSVVQRASTIIHESRHADGECRHGADRCVRGGSCDESYESGCSGVGSGSGKGAVGYQVDWLWWYIVSLSGKTGIEADLRQHAVNWVNVLLDRAFIDDPCFDIGPNGEQIDTCPLPSCETQGNMCF
jgi:hypothetical protein